MLIAIPTLTMSLLSEEKKQGTYDLLLTAPISATQITLGKYLAGLAITMVLVFLSQLYPLMTSLFVDFPVGPVVASLFGLCLLLGGYVAVGLFASSLTSSAMVSVILGILLSLAIVLITSVAEDIDHPFLARWVDHVSVVRRLQSFLLGNIQTDAIIFFLSLITLFVFLTQRVIESSRWR